MDARRARYYLLSDGTADNLGRGAWRFVLSNLRGGEVLTASDVEPECDATRLCLWGLVRGLEAIDEPAAVTLVTSSSYVRRGIQRGLAAWKANGWKWERFGRLVEVRNVDLWQRVDQALKIHHVECRSWRVSEDDNSHPESTRDAHPKAVFGSPPSPSFDQRTVTPTPRGYFHDPAVLVVRRSRRSFRVDDRHLKPPTHHAAAQPAAC